MTSINTSTSASQYYQLSNLTGNTSTSTGTSSSSSLSLASILDGTNSSSGTSLADILNGASSSSGSGTGLASMLDASADDNSSSAYTLDLSPQAQAILNGTTSSTTSSTSTTSAAAQTVLDNASVADSLSSGDTFTLTSAQQKSLDSILQKYSDLPQTQANFEAMQNDLNAAGLSTTNLEAQDQVNTFNPDQLLIEELNGSAPDVSTQNTTGTDEATKATNFMQTVVQAWTNELSQNSASSSASGTAATSGA